MADKTLKTQLLEACTLHVSKRHETILAKMEDIQNAISQETKSSAGDKHETGRAMLQLEREKLGKQLAQIESFSQLLSRIDSSSIHHKVGLGSMVYTTQGNYYISISCGQIFIGELSVYCISAATPMAQLLIGKQEEDKFQFKGKPITIPKIV